MSAGHSIVDVGRWLARRFGLELEPGPDQTTAVIFDEAYSPQPIAPTLDDVRRAAAKPGAMARAKWDGAWRYISGAHLLQLLDAREELLIDRVDVPSEGWGQRWSPATVAADDFGTAIPTPAGFPSVGGVWQGEPEDDFVEPRTRQEEPMDTEGRTSRNAVFRRLISDNLQCCNCGKVFTPAAPDGSSQPCPGCGLWGVVRPRADRVVHGSPQAGEEGGVDLSDLIRQADAVATAEPLEAALARQIEANKTTQAALDRAWAERDAARLAVKSERKILQGAIEAAEANNRILAQRLDLAVDRGHKAENLLAAVRHEARVLIDELDGAWWLKAADAVANLRSLVDPPTRGGEEPARDEGEARLR